MKKYRFYKNELGWFIDIPRFPFNKAWLAMVAGADDLLDKLSDDQESNIYREIFIEIGSKVRGTDYTDVIMRTQKLGLAHGAIYKPLLTKLPNNGFGKNKLWLCPATLWVFWRYPKKIYFKVV